MKQLNDEYFKRSGKLYRASDGKVAVLVSHGFGAGCYSWNSDEPQCLFDADIAIMVLEGSNTEAIAILAEEKFGEDFYPGGACGLRVHFLNPGAKFLIDVYNGNESLVTLENDDFHVA